MRNKIQRLTAAQGAKILGCYSHDHQTAVLVLKRCLPWAPKALVLVQYLLTRITPQRHSCPAFPSFLKGETEEIRMVH